LQRVYLDPNCPEKFKKIPYHTGCLRTSKYAVKLGLSDQDKKEIVELHDKWRMNTEVPAKQMLKMVRFKCKKFSVSVFYFFNLSEEFPVNYFSLLVMPRKHFKIFKKYKNTQIFFVYLGYRYENLWVFGFGFW
jgi:hypothetical protein